MASALSYWERHLAHKAPGTTKNYRSQFEKFVEWVKMSPEKLYETHKNALEKEDKRETDIVPQLVIDYIMKLEREGKSAGTIKNVITSIKVFFIANKLTLDIPKDEMPALDYSGQRVISKAQIRTLHEACSNENKLRNRALIMFAKDSGLRPSDVALITIKEYLDAEIIPGGFKVFRMPILTKKKKRFAYAHIGPEATEAIDAYIDERRTLSGEPFRNHKRNGEMNHHPFFNVDQALFLGRNFKPMSKDALGQQLTRLCRFLANNDKISYYSFRKFHRTNLEGAGMHTSWIKKLRGKATSTYSRPEENGELTKAYIDAYPSLKVFDSPIDIRTVESLETQVQDLKDQLLQREQANDELGDIIKGLQISDEENRKTTAEILKRLKEQGL